MKLRPCFLLSLGLFLAPALPGQEPPPAALAGPAESAPRFSANQLDLLLGPIALYPDALIALILPAATESSDLVMASRYLKNGGDPAQLEDQPWDDSVKSLAHYGTVVSWMDDNLGWTKQLGEAFLEQPAEVMKAVQRLRAKAKADGALVDTPEQQMVMDGDDISIVPTQPDTLYVPRYDPDVVYYVDRRDYPNPMLTFGPAYPAGLWLTYDIDWGRRSLWYSSGRDLHRDWRHPVFPGRPGFVTDPNRQPWRPPSRPIPRPRPVDPHRPPPGVFQPPPLPGAPPRPPGWHRDPPGRPDEHGRDPRAPGATLPNPPTFVPGTPTERPRNPDRDHDDRRERPTPPRDNNPPNPSARSAPPASAPPPARPAAPPPQAPPPPRDNPTPSADDRRPRSDQPN